jgi:DNA-binding beta-propeller fold protein YncE
MSIKRNAICSGVLAAFLFVIVLAPMAGGQETEREKAGLVSVSDVTAQIASVSPAKRPPSPVPVISMASLLQPMGIPTAKLGIFTLYDDSSIKLLDIKKLVTYGPYLKGHLGTIGGGLSDVVLDKKGKTALVSNISDKKVFFISLAKTTAPVVLGSVTLSNWAEDIALTPNGKFAMATSIAGTAQVASINVKTRALVQELTIPGGYGANAVTIAKDNKTVVTADYSHNSINYFLLDSATGVLTYKGRRGAGVAVPVNVVISPDGKTVFTLSYMVDASTCGFGYLYLITAPGAVTAATQRVPAPSADLETAHGAAFSKDGKKLYVLGGLAFDADGLKQHIIYVFNVTAPGTVSYSGVSIKIHDFLELSGQFYGVDSMALTPDGKYLFLSNHCPGAGNRIAVVDLKLNAHVYSLIACDDDKIPAGISFKGF